MKPQPPIVMFIDDDPVFIDITERRLMNEGMTCVYAPTGKMALDELKKDPLPSIILLDLIMPEMDGFDLLKVLKEDPRTAHIPVIVFSNDARKEYRDRVQALGAAGFLEKIQSTPHDIADAVKNVLAQTSNKTS